ncbi:MAG: Ppx/GppA family phosphatase [Myxococcales bacterium]|nr:Ppx/GppA family phosphatase [Myxococcales bacterium]
MERASTPPPALEAAAVDLGSHSFHLVVARLSDGRLEVRDRMRERVSLAAGLDREQRLSEPAVERALACLARFGERLRGMRADRVRAVGTNTLRQARNSASFAERAQRALGYPIETISGQEEARLVYLGVGQTVPSSDGAAERRLVIDIGGGSTECIIGEGTRILEADSLFMGCVGLTQRCFPDGELTKERFRKARLAALIELAPLVRPYLRADWQAALGSSGTVHAVAAAARANGWASEGIGPAALKSLRKALCAAGHVTRVEVRGLDAERATVIPGGLAILEALCDAFALERLLPAPGGLREGVLHDLVGRIRHEDVRERTIRGLVERYRVDRAQAARLGRCVLALLDEVAEPWHVERARAAQLLGWAAQLCEIGLAVAHTGYHRHSAYIVENAHLPGFAREDQTELAAIVLGHRRKLRRGNFARLAPERVEEVMLLTLLFRVAAALCRSRDEEPLPRVVVRGEPHALELGFPDGWLDEHPLTAAVLADSARELGRAGVQLAFGRRASAPPSSDGRARRAKVWSEAT